MGFWVEIVTLLIPGFNDSRDELQRLTAFVAGVSPDIPWHVTAFHGDYKMTEPAEHDGGDAADGGRHRARDTACATSTPATCPGSVGDLEDTRCAACGELLIARYGYHIRDYRITARRPLSRAARRAVPGRWSARVRRPDHRRGLSFPAAARSTNSLSSELRLL